MAFLPVNLTLWSNAQNPNTPRNLPQWWGYSTTTDNQATVLTAGYFNIDPGTLLQSSSFRVGDFLYCNCSDGPTNIEITALSPNITTAAIPSNIAAGSITTNMLGNNIVTAAKIANATITTTQLSASAGILGSQIANNAIASANIASGAVTLVKLSAGVTPAFIVTQGLQYTTHGGSVSEAIAAPGALTTDLAFVQLVAPGTNTVSVSYAVVTASVLTVTFSADPGTNAIVNYIILRIPS